MLALAYVETVVIDAKKIFFVSHDGLNKLGCLSLSSFYASGSLSASKARVFTGYPHYNAPIGLDTYVPFLSKGKTILKILLREKH
jgi:hypothetical protein